MALVKLNNRGVRSATTFGSISALGEMRFISKQTASASATISFTSGIDSTYKEYLFTFNNIHASADSFISFQGNAAGGSGYNETITSTFFHASHDEADSYPALYYRTDSDQAEGTAFQRIGFRTSTDNDMSTSGYLHLFNPSSTTFVKHFMSRFASADTGPYTDNAHVAGYFNTTSAIDDIQFKMSAGNIDAGDICLYGIN
jgi:hypothetical protein